MHNSWQFDRKRFITLLILSYNFTTLSGFLPMIFTCVVVIYYRYELFRSKTATSLICYFMFLYLRYLFFFIPWIITPLDIFFYVWYCFYKICAFNVHNYPATEYGGCGPEDNIFLSSPVLLVYTWYTTYVFLHWFNLCWKWIVSR